MARRLGTEVSQGRGGDKGLLEQQLLSVIEGLRETKAVERTFLGEEKGIEHELDIHIQFIVSL